MTIINFSIEYDSINSRNTFTNGDTVNGRIILEVSKDTKIKSLVFIAIGGARVCWTENYGEQQHYVWANENYYVVKHHILRKAKQDGPKVITKGRHVFPFSFTIPDRKIPSSFQSGIGQIVHKLKAELKQSMKLTKKAKAHFTFVSEADMGFPGLMEPQYHSKDKSIKVFGSGNISMDVHTKRMGYQQGEALKIKVEVRNHSTRSVKPKFILYEKKIYSAQDRMRVHTNVILKDKTEAVASSGKETVTKVITIPRELPPSILNCSIIKLEYWLKIYLDVKYASNPVVNLPIVVLPSFEDPAMTQPPAAASASAGFGLEAFGNPNQAAWRTTPQVQTTPQAVDPPPPYGAHAMYPSNRSAK